MLFGEKILDYWDDILKDLATVVAIPSVAKPQEGEHPFGDQCARALDTVVAMAEGYGLKAKNVGYHAAHAEYGEGEGNAHIVYAPERGQVGVVLLTSLNVPSSKVYASL